MFEFDSFIPLAGTSTRRPITFRETEVYYPPLYFLISLALDGSNPGLEKGIEIGDDICTNGSFIATRSTEQHKH